MNINEAILKNTIQLTKNHVILRSEIIAIQDFHTLAAIDYMKDPSKFSSVAPSAEIGASFQQ